MSARGKTYHIWTIGCQMNVADSQRLAGELEALGYSWSDRAEDADVIVLNSCVVRQQAEDKVCGRLTSLAPVKRARPGAVIALMGCFVAPRTVRGLGARFPFVDVFMRPSETAPLLDFLGAPTLRPAERDADDRDAGERTGKERPAGVDASLQRAAAERAVEPPQPPSQTAVAAAVRVPDHDRGRTVAAYVPVVYGCSWACTYCIIPSRRGPERSRASADIEAHVRSLVDQGMREVTLLGQIVDRYGHDRGESSGLARLLERLDQIDGLARIRFLTSHPSFLTDDLLDRVADLPHVMEHIEVPVQAGDDAVLARMKRGYTADDYRRVVETIRQRVPSVAIHTDVIVGFPGETTAQFASTYELLAQLRLDKAHIARYSPRPGTVAAATLADDVADDEKERRRKSLDDLQASICADINAGYVGRSVEVLVDGRDGPRWRGRTRTNKLVYFEDDGSPLGQLRDVTIDWSGPWSMVGHAS